MEGVELGWEARSRSAVPPFTSKGRIWMADIPFHVFEFSPVKLDGGTGPITIFHVPGLVLLDTE
jgi:hypothetical protein